MYDLPQLIGEPGFLPALRCSLQGSAPPPLIRDAKIKITSLCNLRCTMCGYWRRSRESALDTDTWKRVLHQLSEQGCRKVHFSGGEVFTRGDFLHLLEQAVGLGLKTNLTSNGTLVDRQTARRLVKAGVNSVSLSLDAPSAAVHDRLRGVPGAFRRTLRALRRIARYSAAAAHPVKIRVNVVVMKHNFRRLPELVRLAGELGATDLHAMPVDEKGASRRRLSRSQIELFNREIAPEVLELRRRYGFSLHRDAVYPFGVTPEEIAYSKQGLYARGLYERLTCLAPWIHLYLSWNGEAYPCCMTNGRVPALGKVSRAAVSEIFHGEPYRDLRAALRQGRHPAACHGCDLFSAENIRLHEALEHRSG